MVGWVGVDLCLMGYVLHALPGGQQDSQKPAAGTSSQCNVSCATVREGIHLSSLFSRPFSGEPTGIIVQNLIDSQEKSTEH